MFNNDKQTEVESQSVVVEKSKFNFQSPKGTRDLLPDQQKYWQFLRHNAEEIARIFGYQRIDVPSFESVNLFDRSLGVSTDIISKELFLVQGKDEISSKSEDLFALRPEFTAGIMRAYIQNGLQTLPQPVKLYTLGSIFRHEKPQKDRFREHFQLDFEILGDPSPKADAWIILTVWQFINSIGLNDLEIQINSLGNTNSQTNYQKKLSQYYQPIIPKLCPTCQHRFKVNILRLLDCKEEQCQKYKEDVPQTVDSLDEKSKDHFMTVLSYLDSFAVSYNLNPFIVRGLDYYSHTAFELGISQNTDHSENKGGGHQIALGGGGRYDGLAETLGANPVSGVGVGLGLDRLVSEIIRQNIQVKHLAQTELFVAGVGAKATKTAKDIVLELLKNGFAVEFSPDKNSFTSQLKTADKFQASYTIIIGEKEAKDGTCIIRDMKSGIQEDVKSNELVSILKERLR